MLKVDHREGKCKEYFDEHKVECTLENLVYGDFQICNKEGQILFIFERKTNADLLASIKDGRYKNQKASLFAAFKPSQIYYIIEGQVDFKETTVQTKKMLQGAVINMMLRDKIGVFTTKSVEETCSLLLNMFHRVCEEPSKYAIEAQAIHKQEVVETKSSDDPQKVFKSMLCQLPHLNTTSANELVSQFHSMKDLMVKLHSFPSKEECVAFLNTIKVNGRKCSKRIVESLVENLY
jgi:ERCC4-type nuclease